MDFKYINYNIEETYAVIELNRPEVYNSINIPMSKEILIALDEAINNQLVRAILITGNGKAFCAGQDLKEAVPEKNVFTDIGSLIDQSYNPLIRKIKKTKLPIVCAVNGIAAGAGTNIAFACDIVVAKSSATFSQVFSKIGLIPDSGGTYTLPRLIGLQKASALMMLGDSVPAEDAEKMGMIYKVYDDESFGDDLAKLMKKISSMPTKALVLIKEALQNSLTNSLEEQLNLEKELQILAGATEDYKEGVNAFLEKRKPKFNGK